ncbi:MAG: SOS response-associated peptidase [Lentilitoribacter sp.]
MCGRFTLQYSWAEMWEMYNLILPEDKSRNVPARHNIAPTQDVLYITEKEGERKLNEGQWWLVPHWAKANDKKYPTFNARSEDAHKKPSFREPFKWGRCLIPADGYFEWTKNVDDGQKDPHYIYLPGHKPFSFAGLSAYNKTLDMHSCTILTSAACDEIKHLHLRQPIILEESVYDAWLNTDTSVDDARALLDQNLDHQLVSHRVNREVGNSRAKGAHLIEVV